VFTLCHVTNELFPPSAISYSRPHQWAIPALTNELFPPDFSLTSCSGRVCLAKYLVWCTLKISLQNPNNPNPQLEIQSSYWNECVVVGWRYSTLYNGRVLYNMVQSWVHGNTCVAKGPKFRRQNTKVTEKNCKGPGKSRAELLAELSKKGRKGAELFSCLVLH
jgi:hypothetical protein